MKLSEKEQTHVVNTLLRRIDIPTRAILAVDGSRRVLVNGRPLSIEQSQSIQEGAHALLRNPTLKLVRDQVRFQAVDKGFLQSDNPSTQLFYKAALLYAQEEQRLVESLIGSEII